MASAQDVRQRQTLPTQRTRSLANIVANMMQCDKLQEGHHDVADTDRQELTRK